LVHKNFQVLLSIAAVVSLALGIFQTVGTPPETVPCESNPSEQCALPKVDWVEGVAIVVAIVIVVVVGSLNDWQKERQFRALNEKKEDRGVKVIRHGDEMAINVKVCLLSSSFGMSLNIHSFRILWLVTSRYLNRVRLFRATAFSYGDIMYDVMSLARLANQMQFIRHPMRNVKRRKIRESYLRKTASF